MAQHLVQVFDNPTFGSIRTLDVDGKVYFCGNDIAAALGYSRARKAVDTHCKGAPKWCPLQTPGGTQQVRFITEGDVYRLIMASRLPAAERFEAWVVDEVLPSIRIQGTYITVQAMRDPAFIARLLETIQEEQARQRHQELLTQHSELLAQIQSKNDRQAAYHYYKQEIGRLDADTLKFSPYLCVTLLKNVSITRKNKPSFDFKNQ